MLGAIAKLFGGGAPKEPDGPPRPVDVEDETVDAWARTHLQMDGWVYVGGSTEDVVLARRVEPAERFTIQMRTETFRWLREEGQRYRGVIVDVEVDAAARQFRLTRRQRFRRSNLEDPHPEGFADAYDRVWRPLGEEREPFFVYVRELCRRAEGGAPEGPESLLLADLRAWTDRTISPGEDVFSHFEGSGAVYVRPGTASRERKNAYRMKLRVESFWPEDGFRSRVEDAFVINTSDSGRFVDEVVRFPEHNLRGEAVTESNQPYLDAELGGFRLEHVERLIEIAQQVAG